MIFNRKYATATATGTHINIPLLKAGSDDFAVGADWTPAAGDVKVVIDGTVSGNIGTLPTAVTVGNTAFWHFVLTAGELTGKCIEIIIADAATKAVQDDGFIIETTGHASAMYPDDVNAVVTYDGLPFDQALRGMMAVLFANGINLATNAGSFKNTTNTKTRFTFTNDVNGNRVVTISDLTE